MMKRQPERQKQEANDKKSSRIRRHPVSAAAAAAVGSGRGGDSDGAGNDHQVRKEKAMPTSLTDLSLVDMDPPPLPPVHNLPTSTNHSSDTPASNPEPTNYYSQHNHYGSDDDDDDGNTNGKNIPSSPAGDFIAKLLVGRYAATRSSSSSSSTIPTGRRISIISDNAKGKAMPPIIDISKIRTGVTDGGSVSSTNKALSRWDTGSTLRSSSTSTTSSGGSMRRGSYDNALMDGLDVKKDSSSSSAVVVLGDSSLGTPPSSSRRWETERTNTPPKTNDDEGGIIDEDMATVSIAKLPSSYHPFDFKDVQSTRSSMLSAKLKDINNCSQQPLKMPVRRPAGSKGTDVPPMLPPIRRSSFDDLDDR